MMMRTMGILEEIVAEGYSATISFHSQKHEFRTLAGRSFEVSQNAKEKPDPSDGENAGEDK